MLHLTWPLVLLSGLGSFFTPEASVCILYGFSFLSFFSHSEHVAHCCTYVPVCVEYCLKQISCVVICFGFSFFYHQFDALIYLKMWGFFFFKNMKHV